MADTIGFIGLGQMGAAIAANLQAQQFKLRVYNRTVAKAKPLLDAGADLAQSPEQTAVKGGIVVSIVADDAALDEICTDQLIKTLSPGGLHISLSTVSPTTSKRLAEKHQAKSVSFLSAPVFGRPEAAAQAKLFVCVSGPDEAKPRAATVLDVIGQYTFDFGPEVGAANVVKLAGNFLLTAAIEAMAEACAFAEKHGVSRADLLNMLNSTLFNCPIYNNYGQRILDADFGKVGFSIPLILKDMHLVQQASSAKQAPMPILNLLCDRYLSAMAKGRGNLDASAIALGAAEDAGLRWF